MIKLGLTGGIGSGKSTVARIFESFGIPIYYADDRAKWLMNKNVTLKSEIKNLFGKDIYSKGQLDRKKLSSIVFQDKNLLNELNKLVHPVVAKDYIDWCEHQNSKIVVKEAAILIESGALDTVDKVVVVSAPAKIRMQRVMKRDDVTEQQVVDRLNNQMTDSQRLKYADFVVDNGGNEMLIPQVKNILLDLGYLS